VERLDKLARVFREQADAAKQPDERERLFEQAKRYDMLAAEAESHLSTTMRNN
jgi:hypothetical protein